MKRYPKHARPLWGVAKRRRAIRYVYGPTTVTVHGTDNAGNEVSASVEFKPSESTFTQLPGTWRTVDRIVATTCKVREDLKIKVSFGEARRDPSVPTFTLSAAEAFGFHEAATPNERRAEMGFPPTLDPGTVLVLPPVEVRL